MRQILVTILIASFFFAAGAESVFAIANGPFTPPKPSPQVTAEAKAPGQTEVFGTNVCISWTWIGRCKKKKVNLCASNYGQWCFVENACGSATEGTYDCSGRCDAVPRPIPDGWGPPCNPPCSYSGTLSWAPGCSGYFSGTVTDDRWYYTDNTASGYSGRFAWWCRNGTWTQTGLGGEVRTLCNADAVPPPPPICSPLNGNACTSAPNLLCGITSTGTINCSGACSAVTPPDSSCPPPPPPCFPDCSKANQVCTGKTFTDANNCGTNNCQGTRSCDYNWKEVAP